MHAQAKMVRAFCEFNIVVILKLVTSRWDAHSFLKFQFDKQQQQKQTCERELRNGMTQPKQDAYLVLRLSGTGTTWFVVCSNSWDDCDAEENDGGGGKSGGWSGQGWW